MILLAVIIILVIGLIYFISVQLSVEAKRKRIKSSPTPSHWSKLLNEKSWFQMLPADAQEKMMAHMKVFLAEKTFQTRQGATATEKDKILVAALACLPLINRPTNYYGLIDRIDIDPHSMNRFEVPRCFTTDGQEISWFKILEEQFQKEKAGNVEMGDLSFREASRKYFLSPKSLKQKNPPLYQNLKEFYQVEMRPLQ